MQSRGTDLGYLVAQNDSFCAWKYKIKLGCVKWDAQNDFYHFDLLDNKWELEAFYSEWSYESNIQGNMVFFPSYQVSN